LSENREAIINAFGDENYHMAYSTLSTLACGSIFYGYIRHGRGKGPTISPPGLFRKVGATTLQTLGLVGLSQCLPTIRMPYTYVESNAKTETPETPSTVKQWRCPMDFRPPNAPESVDGISGMERITRHSIFWSSGLIALGPALTSTFIPEIVMFSFPVIFAYIGGAHQDHRFLKGSGGTLSIEKYNKTSNLPFIAILRGDQSLSDVMRELKGSNMAAALALSSLYAVKRFLR
jgi:uncharacterized membrane protein